MPKGQILPKADTTTSPQSIWFPRDVPLFKRRAVKVLVPAFCTPLAVWCISQFFQLRGYVNLTASRVVLVIALFVLLGPVWIFALNRKAYRILTGVFLTVVMVGITWLVDRVTLKKQDAPTALVPTQSPHQIPTTSKTTSITMPALFARNNDYEIVLNTGNTYAFTWGSNKVTAVTANLVVNTLTQTYYFKFLLPDSPETFRACMNLANPNAKPYTELNAFLRQSDQGDYIEGPIPPNTLKINHPKFSGKVFLFHESKLTLKERAQIEEAFTAHRMAVEYRGMDALVNQLYYDAISNGVK